MAAFPASCSSCIADWHEETTREFGDGTRLAHACVSQTYTGDIDGDSVVEYLLSYDAAGRVRFVGLEVIIGAIGGRRGTVVIKHDGTLIGNHARSDWSFVEGSGTGELRGLRGSGTFESVDARNVDSSFIYTFGEY